MKKVLFLISFLFLSFGTAVAQETVEAPKDLIDLHPCKDSRIGVELLCNHNWKQELEQNAVMMIISDDPAVLLTVGKAKEPVTGIEELTQARLKVIGQYADGFQTEQIQVGGDQAIRVEGFALDYPEMRLLDFYVIHDYTLYSFLFSVNPKRNGISTLS